MVLGIYGAGGLGREVLELARIINRKDHRWEEFIFIDDADITGTVNGCGVHKYEKAKDKYGGTLEIAMGIGEPAVRKKLFGKIKDDGISAPTLIHPDVHIPETTAIGQGVVIQHGCFISCNVTIKDYVFIQPQCSIGHDDVLEEGCMVAGFGNIGGMVSIGKWTYLGLSTAVKQLVNIGDHSIIGMGAVVQKDIPDRVTAMGNPARAMLKNEAEKVFK